jgi:hypothetical protein
MSDTPKHTPGPWYTDSRGQIWRRPINELYEYGGGVAGDKPLASVVRGWYNEDESGYPVEANAQLIAAAPEMLEALKECRLFIGRMPHPDFANGGTVDVIYKNILQAIAKAEGSTP